MKKIINQLIQERQRMIIEKLGLSDEEFMFITDSLNGIVVRTDENNCKRSLLYNLQDSCEYWDNDKTHNINFSNLENKILDMNYIQCLILINEVELFWDNDFHEFFAPRIGGIKNPMEALQIYLLKKK